MATRGKKYRTAVERFDPAARFQPREAIEHVKKSAYAKFDETVDVALRLGVDPRHADQIVRGTVVLPHGTGKKVRVLVLTQGERVRRPRRRAPTSWASSTSPRSRRDGSTSTPSWRPPT